ncbi:MAG TPA: PepSY-associated TM helix domain-containing protein, partial [Gammaproteobacteria bacterium]|nr:PepSY-associated TM helix domain-containing protein [Gammaproteobacteria bacterium]
VWVLNLFGGDPSNPDPATLRTVVYWHFGRFGGMTGRLIWVVIGLIPGVLFVTGFIMWLMRRQRRLRAAALQAPARASPTPVLAGEARAAGLPGAEA